MWCSTPVKLGGLGWSSDKIGVSLMLFGVCTAVGMTLIFPMWERLQGPIRMFMTGGLVTGAMAVAMPVTALIAVELPDIGAMPFLVLLGAIRTVANSSLFVIASMFSNNSVHPAIRGTFNGLSFTCVAAVRTVAPAVCGQ